MQWRRQETPKPCVDAPFSPQQLQEVMSTIREMWTITKGLIACAHEVIELSESLVEEARQHWTPWQHLCRKDLTLQEEKEAPQLSVVLSR
jgi:hypothetical protein